MFRHYHGFFSPTEEKNSRTSVHSTIETKPSSPLSTQRSSTSARRVRIPDKPKGSALSLWGILKSCIGHDLSQIPLPINFNEPLSMLQRLTEELENAELLDKAASCSCPYEQLVYLAVFVISGYSRSTRTTKPFNPLLGETYEFDRMSDLGWRVICEQISHHPPVSAHHCEGNGWIFWQEFSFETKFTGNDIQVTPFGEANVEFSQGNSFKWNKIETTVHNFLIGSLWVDHKGVVEITGKNNAEGIVCKLDFIPYSGSSMKRIKNEMRKVKGEVLDADGVKKWNIEGNCDDKVEISPVLTQGTNEEVILAQDTDENVILAQDTNEDVIPAQDTDEDVILTQDTDEDVILDESRIAWRCGVLPEGSENYYSYSKFACQLNEPEDGVAPTDSRLRPDQRFMEDGLWEEASQEKVRLEEKQRKVIQERSEDEDTETKPYIPLWFEPTQRDDGSLIHKYNGTYWKCKEQKDWSKCPDIF